MRIAMGLEYDGSPFHGWQIQEDTDTVQSCVETALSKVADHAVRVYCAGRTDAGVHAVEQVIHFETSAERSMRSWILGGNANLPYEISFSWAKVVPDTFHARFSARSRRYRYVIINRWVRSALYRNRACWVPARLDEVRMHEAAQDLVGQHDFSSYRALACQAKSPIRNIHSIPVQRNGEFIYLDIEANAFLHHMVRNIAGVLIAIGKGERPIDWAGEVLALKDRRLGGVTASAEGLYFVEVGYDTEFGLPSGSPTVQF